MERININVIDESGNKHKLDIELHPDMNLMDVLRSHDLVEGACGGMALCATCHCYIESEHQLSQQNDDELAMLDQLFSIDEKKSRLACQIPITDLIDNMVVKIATPD